MRQREPREVWERRVRRWERSGRSCRAFAAREGVSPSTLNWWRWRLRVGAGSRRSRSPAFVQVVQPTELLAEVVGPASAKAIEIVLASGTRVVVPAGVATADLTQVLSALGMR